MGLTQRLRDRLAIECDLIEWRRQVRRFCVPPPTSFERRLLICDLLAVPATAKVEAIFGYALSHHGFRTTVLLAGRNPLLERIYAAAGIRDLVVLSDYSEPSDRAEAAKTAGELIGDRGFDALIDFELDGVRVGRNALSRALRHLRSGHLNPDDRRHWKLATEALEDSIVAARAAARVIERLRPNAALFCERGYTPAGEVFDQCTLAGVPVIQWLGAPQSDCLLLKRYGRSNRAEHPLSLDDEAWQSVLSSPWSKALDETVVGYLRSNYESGAWFNRQQLQSNKARVTPGEVKSRLGLDPARKTAVIFSHILYDATFFYGDNLYKNYEEWLIGSVGSAIGNPNLNWVIKVHPVNVWRSKMDGKPMEQLEQIALERTFGPLPDHIHFLPADTDINGWSLYEATDYGLTVRGTIGLELPCLGIPVVTAGTGRYSGRGFTIDPGSIDEFQSILSTLHQQPALNGAEVELARRYAFGTFFRRPVPIHSFTYDHNAAPPGSPLAHNVWLNLGAGDRLPEDLTGIANWIASERAADYMFGGELG